MTYLLVLAVALGLIRVAGVTSAAFQAVAHFYVAVVFTAAYYDKPKRYKFLGLGVALTVLEVACFFLLR